MKRLLLLLLSMPTALALRAQTPTFAGGVAQILYDNCTKCHRTGGIAPFPIESYADASSQGSRISYSVETKHMPPWPPDADYSRFHGERLLRQGQIDSIIAWVDGGKPRGDVSQEPAAPVFTSNTRLTYPIDTLYRIPTYTIGTGQDEYRCFVIPAGVATQEWIRGIEMVSGNATIVHHMLLYADTTGQCRTFDQADSLPGYTSFGGVGVSSATLLGGWVPGSNPIELPEGFGIRLSRRADLVLQVHYAPGSLGLKDSSYFRFSFAPVGATRREVFQAPILNHQSTLLNGPLALAPNEEKVFHERFTVPIKASVLSVAPHAHLINRNWKVYVTPFGRPQDTVPLIRINSWHFHWQGQYWYERPKVINFGDRLEALAWYDNSGNNPYNPNLPPRPVTAGEGTMDEMMLVYFAFTLYQPGDENLDLFPNNTVTATAPTSPPLTWAVYGHRIRNATGAFPQGWQLRSVEGRLLAHGSGSDPLPVRTLTKGLYVIWVEDKTGGTPIRYVAGN